MYSLAGTTAAAFDAVRIFGDWLPYITSDLSLNTSHSFYAFMIYQSLVFVNSIFDIFIDFLTSDWYYLLKGMKGGVKMTINERIKQLRKEKKLNQKQFASMLGFTQSGASYMEQPGNNVSDSSIKSICTVFNVNEEWLRNGVEPMYIEPDAFSLDEFVKQHGGSDLELQIIKTYFDLDPEVRDALLKEFIKLRLLSSNASEAEDTVSELEEKYKKTVLNSVLKKGSTATNTTPDTAEKQKNA